MDEVLLKGLMRCKIIDNPSEEDLRGWALDHGGVITEFGNLSVVTQVRNRMAKFTEVFMDETGPESLPIVDEVFDYLRGREVIMLDRVMCMTPGFKKNCRLYVTAEYARLPLMWGNTMFPSEGREPDFVTLTVPEWPEKKVLVFPDRGLTIILGSDYKGENKKAMLRQLMYSAKGEDNLGLHAASKVLRVAGDGKIGEYKFLLFGLSGTGKTSLSCHSHWLVHPETVVIRQDDVVVLRRDGSAVGTENSFYIKTDGLEPDSQPLLYAAALSPRAILENVFVDSQTGRVDFFDSRLTSNGRAIVKREDIAFTDGQIDIDRVDFILFITRRYDIMPPVVRLNHEWAAAAFMLGESVETSAGDPTQAGKSLRVVGTNPFIVGSYADEGNMFLDILRANPAVQCFMLNTGVVGGMVNGQKITVRDTVKIMEMMARDRIVWERDAFWGYEVPVYIPEVDLNRFEVRNYYNDEDLQRLSLQLREERIAWLRQFDGLSRDIADVIAR